MKSKLNKITLIFFARTDGKDTQSAQPLITMLGLLTVDNVYRLQVLRFIQLWHKGLLPDVDNMFHYASNIHGYNTRYSTERNLHKSKVRTNIGK